MSNKDEGKRRPGESKFDHYMRTNDPPADLIDRWREVDEFTRTYSDHNDITQSFEHLTARRFAISLAGLEASASQRAGRPVRDLASAAEFHYHEMQRPGWLDKHPDFFELVSGWLHYSGLGAWDDVISSGGGGGANAAAGGSDATPAGGDAGDAGATAAGPPETQQNDVSAAEKRGENVATTGDNGERPSVTPAGVSASPQDTTACKLTIRTLEQSLNHLIGFLQRYRNDVPNDQFFKLLILIRGVNSKYRCYGAPPDPCTSTPRVRRATEGQASSTGASDCFRIKIVGQEGPSIAFAVAPRPPRSCGAIAAARASAEPTQSSAGGGGQSGGGSEDRVPTATEDDAQTSTTAAESSVLRPTLTPAQPASDAAAGTRLDRGPEDKQRKGSGDVEDKQKVAQGGAVAGDSPSASKRIRLQAE